MKEILQSRAAPWGTHGNSLPALFVGSTKPAGPARPLLTCLGEHGGCRQAARDSSVGWGAWISLFLHVTSFPWLSTKPG